MTERIVYQQSRAPIAPKRYRVDFYSEMHGKWLDLRFCRYKFWAVLDAKSSSLATGSLYRVVDTAPTDH